MILLYIISMIFKYNSYKKYLKEHIMQLPKRGYGEARRMANHLHVSTAYMSQILSADKDLNLEQAHELSSYLGHNKLETDYFFYLVQLARAGTTPLKKYCTDQLQKLTEQSLKMSERISYKKNLTDEEKSIFYSSAVYSAVHVYTSLKTVGCTIEDVTTRFDLTRTRANAILTFLAQCHLCIEDNGYFKIGTQSTHIGTDSPHLIKHHSNWRMKAASASENLSNDELMFTTNVSLSHKDFKVLREEMAQFVNQFLKKIEPSPPEEMACFNMDFFWIRK